MSFLFFILELGESVLNVLGCLVPFLENDLLDSLPYTVASTLAVFPPTLHKDTIDLLCSNLLPMTLGMSPNFTYLISFTFYVNLINKLHAGKRF